MHLPEGEIQAMAWALIDEFLGEDKDYTDEINIEQLRKVFIKHEGLVENLSFR